MPISSRIGLARTLSKLGYCSRSQAFELIREGKVRLNGRVLRDPEAPVRLECDRIEVGGTRIESADRIYLMMNKPRGVVTTASDEQGRKTVYDLLDAKPSWVAPVGRLDKASEGLLLLTNDSEWAAAITDPASHLSKTYHVQVGVVADDDLLGRVCAGVKSRGEPLRVLAVALLRQGKTNSWLEIKLDEGKNRHIRRIFEALEIEVLRLVRIAIGPLQLGDLSKSKVRPLRADEKANVDQAITLKINR
jgi:23S rRNA pseudouridine2605 synthase